MTNTHRTVEVPLVLPVHSSSGGRGLGNVSHVRVQFGEDVIARYRGGGPEVELEVSSPAANGYEHVVTKYLTPAEAYALAQRLLSAVEATSRTPGSLPLVVKEPAGQEIYEDATAIVTVLLDLDEFGEHRDSGSKKIRMVKAVRQLDLGVDYESRDDRLRAVLKLWGITPRYDDRGGLRLVKLVVESWQARLVKVQRGES
jgi:hypothetical protein